MEKEYNNLDIRDVQLPADNVIIRSIRRQRAGDIAESGSAAA